VNACCKASGVAAFDLAGRFHYFRIDARRTLRLSSYALKRAADLVPRLIPQPT